VDDACGYESDMGTYLDLDDDALDRLLSAPGEGQPTALAALLAAAAASEPGPITGEAAALAAFREVMRRPASGVHARRKPRPARASMVRLAVAGLAAGGVLVGGVAAAATGSLPGAAQQAARDMLAHVGVTVPGPVGVAGESPDGPGRGNLGGGAAGGAADLRPGSQGAEVGGIARTPTAAGAGIGTETPDTAISAGASDRKAKADERGWSADVSKRTPPVPVPNQGAGNPEHPRRDAPGLPSAANDARGGKAGASSGSAG